jgi:hypothetical protein
MRMHRSIRTIGNHKRYIQDRSMSSSHEFPSFLIIGAAKSGTTVLFDLLGQHPQVFQPFAKEIKFFNNDKNYARGVDWYKNTCFRNSGGFTARGEASPHYLYWGEKVIPRMQETFGSNEVKFIAILRDPVQRAYSQYWQGVQRENESLSFKEALEVEPQRLVEMKATLSTIGTLRYAYFGCGCYATQLKPYLHAFPPERFHFLLTDDLKNNLNAAMESVTAFLGIRSNFSFSTQVSNQAYTPRSRRLFRFLESPKGAIGQFLKKFVHLLPEAARYRLRQSIVLANRREAAYPPMNPETERSLRERYRQEMLETQDIIGRDLSTWLGEKS